MSFKKPTKTEKRLELRLIYRRAKYVVAFIILLLLIVSFVSLMIYFTHRLILVFK